ncbi:MAG: hypothetical protein LBK08_02040 [Treponema sp.]|jgi:cytoplasmic iron level regulating protein YaaA (DUF328/UPF0246 family)|nr:hypothetical protein [Treponema sp.]
MNENLYNIIYDKLKDEQKKQLLFIQKKIQDEIQTAYEIKNKTYGKPFTDFENLWTEFDYDLEKYISYDGTIYKKSVIYQTILKAIKDLTGEGI